MKLMSDQYSLGEVMFRGPETTLDSFRKQDADVKRT